MYSSTKHLEHISSIPVIAKKNNETKKELIELWAKLMKNNRREEEFFRYKQKLFLTMK
jgi:hypothetical protein